MNHTSVLPVSLTKTATLRYFHSKHPLGGGGLLEQGLRSDRGRSGALRIREMWLVDISLMLKQKYYSAFSPAEFCFPIACVSRMPSISQKRFPSIIANNVGFRAYHGYYHALEEKLYSLYMNV